MENANIMRTDTEATLRAEARRHFFHYYKATRMSAPADEQAFLATGDAHNLTVGGESVCAWSWGSGANVLLLHGIYGRASQLKAFVEPLVARGFRVTALDAPGHGQSRGGNVHGDFVSRALLALEAKLGAFDAVIAHSIASVWLMYAFEHGFETKRLVLVSPLANASRVFRGYVAMNQVPAAVAEHLKSLITHFEGDNCWTRFSPSQVAASWTMPGLIVHDEKDELVPLSDSQKIVGSWPDSRLVATQGLGHFAILSDVGVVDTVVSFVSAGKVEA